jgi:hypothetical protein
MAFKVKFREIKKKCRGVVEAYRTENDDKRQFPEFNIEGLAQDGRKGYIQLMRKPKGKGKEPIYSDALAFESFPELVIIIENLGKAWEATN